METDLSLLIPRASEMWARHRDVEAILQFLRKNGCTKNDCMAILRRAGIAGKSDVKSLVHFSEAWSDRKTADEALHEAVEEDLQKR